jgi:isocitrate/isopropylmalate dehydrogenase
MEGVTYDAKGQGLMARIAVPMMLSYLGWPAWEQRSLAAIERVIAQGECLPRDQGGHATTREVGKAVAATLA